MLKGAFIQVLCSKVICAVLGLKNLQELFNQSGLCSNEYSSVVLQHALEQHFPLDFSFPCLSNAKPHN